MARNPFWDQKRTKNKNERRILSEIRDRSPTFTELQRHLLLSKSTLSEHLTELQKGGKITRRLTGKRIEYITTDRGREAERLRFRSLSDGFQVIGQLVRADELSEMFKLGEDAPEFFEAFTIWLADFTAFIMSSEYLDWVGKHRGAEGRRIMTRELSRRLGMPFTLGTSPIKETAETIARLQRVLDVMREVVAQGKGH